MDIELDGLISYEEGNGLIFESEEPLYILANRENYDFKYSNKINNHYYNNPLLDRILVERNGIAVVSTVEEIQGKFFTNITVLIDTSLDNLTLMNLFRTVSETISTTSWDVNALNKNRLDNQLGNFYNTIFIACRKKSEVSLPFDISLFYEVKEIVDEALRQSFKVLGYPRNIVKYLRDANISLDIIEDVARKVTTKDITHNVFVNQLENILDDVNIVAYIVAIIRLEEDYNNERIVIKNNTNIENTANILCLNMVNQIAGKEAVSVFNKIKDDLNLLEFEPFTKGIVMALVSGCIVKLDL